MVMKVDLCEGDNALIWQELVACVGYEEWRLIAALESSDPIVGAIASEVIERFFESLDLVIQQQLVSRLKPEALEKLLRKQGKIL
jgi:hypothetical protein